MQYVYSTEALHVFEYYMIIYSWGTSLLAIREFKEKFQDRYKEECDNHITWVYKQWNRPSEGKLPLSEAIGHINKVNNNKEQEEYGDIVHYDVYVKRNELEPINQSECT